MPHIHCFYIEPDAVQGNSAVLDGTEAHHALHVVRVRHGDPVVLFDGVGRELQGRVSGTTRHDVTVQITEDRNVEPESRTLTLLQAALHRDKATEELIRRCTEVGVARFVVYPAERSERSPRISEKWRRWAIESCKQCGRLWLPEFSIAPDFETALKDEWSALLIATAEEKPVPLRTAIKGDAIALAVGPEGDFTDDERVLAKSLGAQPVSLGPATFRSEVAAMIASALIRYELGCLGP